MAREPKRASRPGVHMPTFREILHTGLVVLVVLLVVQNTVGVEKFKLTK